MVEVGHLIRSDLYRYAKSVSAQDLFYNYLRNRSFRYSFWLRMCNSKNSVLRIIARLMHSRLSVKFSIQIPRETVIGPGLYIGHHMCVVIHPKTVIGANFTISQFTTIGSDNDTPAVIGDCVYMAPGVSIVENVIIGNNSRIGAGAIVVKDVPENVTVAGNPARVISNRGNNPKSDAFWQLT